MLRPTSFRILPHYSRASIPYARSRGFTQATHRVTSRLPATNHSPSLFLQLRPYNVSAGSGRPDVNGEQPPLIPEPPMPTAKHSSVLAPVVANRVDLVKLGLPEYRHKFVLVVDNLFTAQDCARYLAAAEASNEWEVAAINGGKPDLQFINTSYRNSGRIMLDDKVLAAEMLSRLRPYLKDIEHMGKSPFHKQLSDNGRFSQDPPARLSRLNERLRFLKYTPDQYFKKHCDGAYYTPDKEEISYYTLQIYLNGSLHESQGGATRIWKPRSAGKQDARKTQPGMPLRDFIDIEPRPGRALIFEQRGLWHSGEPIKEGIKYTIRTDLFYKVCPVSE